MSNRTAFLFPGLGAYCAGVLGQAHREFPRIPSTFQEIDEVAAEHGLPSVSAVLFAERPQSIRDMLGLRSELLQLAIFGTSVATFRVLVDEGARPHLLVGHSFGEIAALTAAGAFTLADGVRLVCARSAALREWEGRGQMAAIGVSESTATHLIGLLDEPDLVVGCVNAPRQTVLSGSADAIARAEHAAAALELVFSRLHLPYASHHPSMRPAVGEFLRLAADVAQRPLAQPVHSPVFGRRYTDNDDLKQAIAECLVMPVRFLDAVRDLHSRGFTDFVEVGALHALTRCVELTVPGARTFAPLTDQRHESDNLRAAARGVAAGRGDVVVPHDIPAARAEQVVTPAAAAPSREETLDRLRALYARVLEYPPEVFAEDAQLEAELGVDSLKQTSLLTTVIAEFGLPTDSGDLRVWEFPTLGRIADHVLAAGQAVAR